MAIAFLGGGFGCGDDEPARDQAVMWMQLATALGQTCSSTRGFGVPDESARTVIAGDGKGERLVDGSDGTITCTVSEAAAGQYDVVLDLRSGEISSFYVQGSLTKPAGADGQGTFRVFFNTTDFSLRQDGCTGTIKQALAGAVWISNLTCPNMTDMSSPGIACTGTGGFIAENCSR